ncbi:hypothetical protein ROZALSC1DRAFT_31822, partial [Rozella allomycis CSF55]
MPVFKSIKLLNSIKLPRVVPKECHTSTNTTNPILIKEKDFLCSCEADVEACLRMYIYESVETCLNNMGIKSSIGKPGGEAHLIGAVDAIWKTGEGTEVNSKSKGTIEVKSPWALGEVGDIIATYQRESQLKEHQHKKIFKAVNQVYGYMSVNSHKYGVLTRFN